MSVPEEPRRSPRRSIARRAHDGDAERPVPVDPSYGSTADGGHIRCSTDRSAKRRQVLPAWADGGRLLTHPLDSGAPEGEGGGSHIVPLGPQLAALSAGSRNQDGREAHLRSLAD
jgi:hypothetical protein